MKCLSCHDDIKQAVTVKSGQKSEQWCLSCATESSEPCNICHQLIDRYHSFEITEGTEFSVFVCHGCLVTYSARKTCSSLVGGVPKAPTESLKL